MDDPVHSKRGEYVQEPLPPLGGNQITRLITEIEEVLPTLERERPDVMVCPRVL